MAAVLYLPDGTDEIILDKEKDYTNLIRKKLGDDIADYLDSYITDLKEQADYTEQKVNSDLLSYESSLEENRDDFQEILELITPLIEYIRDSKKIDRNKITKDLNRIETIVCDAI